MALAIGQTRKHGLLSRSQQTAPSGQQLNCLVRPSLELLFLACALILLYLVGPNSQFDRTISTFRGYPVLLFYPPSRASTSIQWYAPFFFLAIRSMFWRPYKMLTTLVAASFSTEIPQLQIDRSRWLRPMKLIFPASALNSTRARPGKTSRWPITPSKLHDILLCVS